MSSYLTWSWPNLTCTSGCNYILCTPDDGRGRHPKHVEWLGSKTNKDCLELHLVGLLNICELDLAHCNTFVISKSSCLIPAFFFLSQSAGPKTDRMSLWSRAFWKLGTTLSDTPADDAGQASLARRLGVVRSSLVSYRGMISACTIAVCLSGIIAWPRRLPWKAQLTHSKDRQVGMNLLFSLLSHKNLKTNPCPEDEHSTARNMLRIIR